ncbi:Glycosyltransferase [Marinovum algicola DG 898]|nr:Glycosyltransferase [Marinovum algicola DG 898]
MTLKVLLCCESFDHAYGGPAYSVRKLGESLASSGVETGFWSFDGTVPKMEKGCPCFQGDFATAIGQFGRPDIVHDNSIWRRANHRIARLCRDRDIPRVVSTRGMLEPWALKHKRWRKRLAWHVYQRHDLNSTALLHATADSEAKAIALLGLRPPVVVIPNGVDLPPPLDRLPEPPRTALFLSRIHPKKGLEMLLDGWTALRPTGWRLRIVGPGDAEYVQEIRERIAALGPGTGISLEGPVTGSAKNRAFAEADLFVLPSYSENFGIVVAEALSFSLPLITTTGTPWKNVGVEGAGWWVAPEPAAIAEALLQATSMPPEALIAMGRRGRKLVETGFAWPVISDTMRQAYETALRK